MTTTRDSGYYAPLDTRHIFQPYPAWTIYVGTTPDGTWVVEYQSIASARYQREYFSTEAEAVAKAKAF